MDSFRVLRGKDFESLLASLNLPNSRIYEDLSETAAILWNNDHLSIKIVSEFGYVPAVQIATFQEPDDYYLFNCNVGEFTEKSIDLFLQYAQDHVAEIYDAALRAAIADMDLPISVGDNGPAWIFMHET